MKFERKCPIAIDPTALDVDWRTGEPQPPEALTDGIAYMTIRGPMTHHTEVDADERPLFESYDALLAKFSEIFTPDCRVVFVSGDTPGGDVSGCFDGARQLCEMKERWGGLLVWYVDGSTCSAGLAWSMAADFIVVPPEGRFGSIGVIAQIDSFKEQAEAFGQKTKLITSGARKADGHPLNDITDDVEKAIQASVDYEANIFFSWVSERRGIDVETIRSFQAGIFHGQQAVDIGLADEVAGESAALAMVAGVELSDAPPGAESDAIMQAKTLAASARAALGLPAPKASAASRAEEGGDDFEAVKKKLGKIAAGSDSKKAARAAGMLKKMAEDDSAEGGEEEQPEKKEHEEPDGDEGSAEDESDASSSAEDSEDDDSDASSSAEDESDAKKCEEDAKKAEASAAEEDAKALAAVSGGAKDAAKVAKSHMLAAKSHRATAARLRREASGYRRLSAQNAVILQQAKAIDALTKRVASLGAPNPAVAAIGAKGTAGTAPKGTGPSASAPKNNNPLASIKNKNVLAAANLTRGSQAFIEEDGELEIALPTPAEAKAHYEKTSARIAELKGGAQ